jgi:hypothetical protein
MLARLLCGAFSVLVIASVVRMVLVGRTDSYYGEKFVASRDKEPFSFWVLVAFYFSLGLFLGWMAISSS